MLRIASANAPYQKLLGFMNSFMGRFFRRLADFSRFLPNSHWQNRLKAILPELIEGWKLDSCEKVIERREQLEEKNWYGANASEFVFIGDWGWVANNCGSYETPKYDPERVQRYIQAGAIDAGNGNYVFS